MYSKFENTKLNGNDNAELKASQQSNQSNSDNENKKETQRESDNQMELAKHQEEQEKSLHSGSDFCKYGDVIVYINDYNNSIYAFNIKDKAGKKLCTLKDGANSIYFDGEYIYAIPYYYRGKGIFKIDLNGNANKIYEGASLQLYLENDKIYFTKQIGFDDMNQNAQGNICVMNKDGSGIKEIAESVKNNFYIQGEYIYYTSQSRQMYKIKKDGTDKELITEGRRFIVSISDEFLVYIDYGNQEEKGIIDLNTNQIETLGAFGRVYKCMGDTYLYTRKRIFGTDLENDETLFKINTSTKQAEEINKLVDFSNSIYYIYKDNAYIQNQNEGMYQMNIYTKEKKNPEVLKQYNKFLGGYAYNFNNYSNEKQRVKILNLDSFEETVIEDLGPG